MDDLKEKLETIFPYFSQEAIDGLLVNAEIRKYPQGQVLCKQGHIEDTSYIILEGSIDVYQHEAGQMQYIDTIKQGLVGELALLLDRPRTADVVAAEDITVLEIIRADFETYVKHSPELLIELSKVIINRVLSQVDHLLVELAQHRKKVGDAPKIFVSYSRKDEAFVRQLASDLGRRNINVWVDIFEIEPGESWGKQIGRALDFCEIMILILSPDGVRSENVDDEWNYYLDNKKVVIPILLHDCTVPFRLHKIQYIPFLDNPYDDSLNRLIAYLNIQESHQ